jgi:hypothetical protein
VRRRVPEGEAALLPRVEGLVGPGVRLPGREVSQGRSDLLTPAAIAGVGAWPRRPRLAGAGRRRGCLGTARGGHTGAPPRDRMDVRSPSSPAHREPDRDSRVRTTNEEGDGGTAEGDRGAPTGVGRRLLNLSEPAPGESRCTAGRSRRSRRSSGMPRSRCVGVQPGRILPHDECVLQDPPVVTVSPAVAVRFYLEARYF